MSDDPKRSELLSTISILFQRIRDRIDEKVGMGESVDTANVLKTARQIELTGDVSGNVLFDGSVDVSIDVELSEIHAAIDTKGGSGKTLTVVVDKTGRVQSLEEHTIPDASTSGKGLVLLSNATNSTSETTAATSAAVKSVQDVAAAAIPASQKGQASGVATLGTDGKVPSSQLPSYVDDVIEAADYEALPTVGESGKIYITIDDDKSYRWTGNGYFHIDPNVGSADVAARLAEARTITIDGDVSGSGDFDGSDDIAISVTLPASGVTAGSVGSSVKVPVITVDAKGRVTAKDEADLPVASSTVAGIVTVSTATDSDSTTAAAAVSSVKALVGMIGGKLSTTLKGAVNGLAELGEDGKVPASQLPEIPAAMQQHENFAGFPVEGLDKTIYLDETTRKLYRWNPDTESFETIGGSDSVLEAAKLTEERAISMTGDGTWSVDFDGSDDVSAAFTLSNTTVTAGTFGGAGKSLSISVDSKGRLTGVDVTDIPAIADASTTVKGLVQLSSAVDSDSEVLAATPKAVKAVAAIANAAIPASEKAAVNGVATLDGSGKVPAEQLPSYVDDVLEFPTRGDFPAVGELGKIYIDLAPTTGRSPTYRWSGSTYVEIGLPVSTADRAFQLATPRIISATGDATWETIFDGTDDATGVLTLSDSGVVAGTYGTNELIPAVTVDDKGRVTDVTQLKPIVRELSHIFSTTKTGNVNSTQWTKLAVVTLPTRYADYSASIRAVVHGYSEGDTRIFDLSIRAKQQNDFGEDPFIQARFEGTDGLDWSIGWVIVDQSGPTVIEFYVNTPLTYRGLVGSVLSHAANSGVCVYLSDQPFVEQSEIVGLVVSNQNRQLLKMGDLGLGLSNASTKTIVNIDDTAEWVSGIHRYNVSSTIGELPSSYGSVLRMGGGVGSPTGEWLSELSISTGNQQSPSGVMRYRTKTNGAAYSAWQTLGTLEYPNVWQVENTFNSNVVVGGKVIINSGGLEIGRTDVAQTPYVDFHSTASENDGDARIICTGGTIGTPWKGTLSYNADSHIFSGDVTAPNFNGALSGNATTATRLQTARTINGVSFNGTANITVADSTKLPLTGGVITGTTASTSATTGALQCRGGLGVSGNIYAAGNVSAYSDRNLKKDIVRVENALEKVLSLNGYTYTRIDTGDRQAGVIAQEVQAVLPEAVSGKEKLAVAYNQLSALFVEAFRDVNGIVGELRSTIDEQNKVIETLKARIEAYEKL